MTLYAALDGLVKGIRLLELGPGTQDDPLTGNLIVSSLHDHPTYDALSYRWASPAGQQAHPPSQESVAKSTLELAKAFCCVRKLQSPDVRTLSANQHVILLGQENVVQITSNLANALRCMRKPDSIRILWIDALCINQNDVEERSAQVALMRPIYTQATTVCVYIDRMVFMSPAMRSKLQTLSEESDISDLGDDPSIWQPLADLLQDQYWDRLWIQQELVLAKKFTVHCNDTRIDGDRLMAFQALLLRRANPELDITRRLEDNAKQHSADAGSWKSLSQSFGLAMVPSKHLLWWRKMYELKSPILIYKLVPPYDPGSREEFNLSDTKYITPIYLLGAMRVATRLQATDPRDRVYGMLGLATDVKEGDIPIVYTKTELEIQTDVARFLLRSSQKLLFLPYAGVSPTTAGSPTHPSWVPHWTAISLFWTGASASASLKATGSSISTDGKTMIVRGMRINHFAKNRISLPFAGLTLLDMAMIISHIINLEEGQSSWRLGQRLRAVVENLGTTLLKSATRLHNSTFVLSGEECFLYMLLILRWHVMMAAHNLELTDLSLLQATSAESFDDIFNVLHASKDSDQTVLRLADLAQFVSDGIIPRDWENYNKFIRFLKTACDGSRISFTADKEESVLTQGGAVEPGDEVWILFGCSFPMVLRPEGESYSVVSAACMYGTRGLMEGLLVRDKILGVERVSTAKTIRDLEIPELIEDGVTDGGYRISTITLI
ncbi:hypothetical protein BP5796_01442 [Coleophoma crateriformis]|uniref:Heterokaryon incompatibility domain-containing protein n=1 Tax=Coleophoma crateriformis TaxID=565419 RepID=A0A3D8T232_9HELO|nr:hypothetical protein BP5796_01442 [Coleophoma crateriformis]